MFYIKLLLSASLAIYAFSIILSASKCSNSKNTAYNYLFSFFIFLQLLNILCSHEHSLLGYSFANPGSLITRGFSYSLSSSLRRVIDPSIIILILIQLFYIRHLNSKKNTAIATIIIYTALFLDFLILSNPIHINHKPAWLSLVPYLSSSLWATAFLLNSRALFNSAYQISPSSNGKEFLLCSIGYILIIVVSNLSIIHGLSEKNLFIAAHYYVWFPENWKAGYGCEDSSKPSRGEYFSNNPELIDSHLSEIEKRNIKILYIDWWPFQPHLRKQANKVISRINPNQKIYFAPHFETQSIDPKNHVLELNNKNQDYLTKSILAYAKKYFNNPNHLSINGKKVINLYTTRHIVGDMISTIKKIKDEVRNKTGHEIYFIGDEAFYNVIGGNTNKNHFMQKDFVAEWDRLNAFDAITLYNPFDPSFNYGNTGKDILINFINRSRLLYTEYKSISETAGLPFLPTVIPAYDDTAIRPNEKHLTIKRTIDDINTFNELSKIAIKISQNNPTKIITITSWNEWNEGTNIEY